MCLCACLFRGDVPAHFPSFSSRGAKSSIAITKLLYQPLNLVLGDPGANP